MCLRCTWYKVIICQIVNETSHVYGSISNVLSVRTSIRNSLSQPFLPTHLKTFLINMLYLITRIWHCVCTRSGGNSLQKFLELNYTPLEFNHLFCYLYQKCNGKNINGGILLLLMALLLLTMGISYTYY